MGWRAASTGAWCAGWRPAACRRPSLTLAVLSHFNLNGEAARSLITLVLSIALFAHRFRAGVRRPDRGDLSCARRVNSIRRRTAAVTVRSALLLGVLVSISSVGAGAIGVVALVLLYPHLPMAQDRRLRHRPRGAADAGRRARPLDDGLGRLAHHHFAAGRLAAGHLHRQLFRHPHPRARLAAGPGGDVVRGGEPHRLTTMPPTASSFFTAFSRRAVH